MQWNDTEFSGFSNQKPWIKVHEDYKNLNVASLEKKENSLLNNYKQLISLSNSEPVLQYGNYDQVSFSNDIITFTREYKGEIIKC